MDINSKKKILSILKLFILLVIVVGIPVYVYFAHRDVISGFNSFDDIVYYLRAAGNKSALLYIAAQIMQIVISFLPGQIFQIAAGTIFGFAKGLVLSIIGALLGSSITFWLASILGKDAILMLFGKERAEEGLRYFTNEKAYFAAFLVFLIPGTPKDVLNYVAGISNMKFLPYLIITTTARIPAMCMSLLFGHMYIEGNRTFMWIIAAVTAVILLLVYLLRKPMMQRMQKLLDRFS